MSEKKQKFIESLLTLGSLLAIFLGFVTNQFPFYLPYLVTFGVVFIVSAFISYTALIFNENIRNDTIRRWVHFVNGILGLSFGGLVSIGFALALSQIQGTYSAILVYVGAGTVLSISVLGTMFLIRRVMNLPDTPPDRGTPG
jgi:threonine/homoserine/homoserine lactone efflux protein